MTLTLLRIAARVQGQGALMQGDGDDSMNDEAAFALENDDLAWVEIGALPAPDVDGVPWPKRGNHAGAGDFKPDIGPRLQRASAQRDLEGRRVTGSGNQQSRLTSFSD